MWSKARTVFVLLQAALLTMLLASPAQAVPLLKLGVAKNVKGPPGAPPLNNMNFSVTANCTPAAPSPNAIATNGTGTGLVFIMVPAQSTCTVVENNPMPVFPAQAVKFCDKKGLFPLWLPPTYFPASATVKMTGPVNVDIINSWTCGPAPYTTLTVKKRILNPGATALTNMDFIVSAKCTPSPASPVTQTINNGSAIGSVDFKVKAGSTCTVTEDDPLPAFPQSALDFCKKTGGVPQWKQPALNPNGGVITVPTAGATAYVINAWECSKTTGELKIIKELTTKQFPFQWPTSDWLINVNCSPAASASSVTINTLPSGSAVITGSAPVLAAPLGANCTISEPTASLPAFSNFIVNYCKGQTGMPPVWNTPTYSPSSNVTVGSGVTTVTVGNSWSCQQPPAGTANIHWIKTVTMTGWQPGWPGQPTINASYTLNTNCASTPTSVTMGAGGTPAGLINVPMGATCNLTETLPPIPPAATAYCVARGKTGASWEAPQFSVPQPMTVNATTVIVAIQNRWKCV
jgi:Domain of unknown function (DUF5979)